MQGVAGKNFRDRVYINFFGGSSRHIYISKKEISHSKRLCYIIEVGVVFPNQFCNTGMPKRGRKPEDRDRRELLGVLPGQSHPGGYDDHNRKFLCCNVQFRSETLEM